jgi:hypothetical protein
MKGLDPRVSFCPLLTSISSATDVQYSSDLTAPRGQSKTEGSSCIKYVSSLTTGSETTGSCLVSVTHLAYVTFCSSTPLDWPALHLFPVLLLAYFTNSGEFHGRTFSRKTFVSSLTWRNQPTYLLPANRIHIS